MWSNKSVASKSKDVDRQNKWLKSSKEYSAKYENSDEAEFHHLLSSGGCKSFVWKDAFKKKTAKATNGKCMTLFDKDERRGSAVVTRVPTEESGRRHVANKHLKSSKRNTELGSVKRVAQTEHLKLVSRGRDLGLKESKKKVIKVQNQIIPFISKSQTSEGELLKPSKGRDRSFSKNITVKTRFIEMPNNAFKLGIRDYELVQFVRSLEENILESKLSSKNRKVQACYESTSAPFVLKDRMVEIRRLKPSNIQQQQGIVQNKFIRSPRIKKAIGENLKQVRRYFEPPQLTALKKITGLSLEDLCPAIAKKFAKGEDGQAQQQLKEKDKLTRLEKFAVNLSPFCKRRELLGVRGIKNIISKIGQNEMVRSTREVFPSTDKLFKVGKKKEGKNARDLNQDLKNQKSISTSDLKTEKVDETFEEDSHCKRFVQNTKRRFQKRPREKCCESAKSRRRTTAKSGCGRIYFKDRIREWHRNMRICGKQACDCSMRELLKHQGCDGCSGGKHDGCSNAKCDMCSKPLLPTDECNAGCHPADRATCHICGDELSFSLDSPADLSLADTCICTGMWSFKHFGIIN